MPTAARIAGLRLRAEMDEAHRQGRLLTATADWDGATLERLLGAWAIWALEAQWPPDGDWTTWLLMGGRGAGKTRAGAEWVTARTRRREAHRIALVAETMADARDVMVEGPSGLVAVAAPDGRPRLTASRRRVDWPNGAVAYLFSAEDPESLRGPQFDAAWSDEIGKWRHGEATWDMLQFGLRLGPRPRQVATTTPRPTGLIKRLLNDPHAAVTRMATAANAHNLAPAFLAAIVTRYAGTRLGRQELDGELIEDRPDALFPRALIERCRVSAAPPLHRVVVAVDPPGASGAAASACGIVVAGKGEDGRAYVIEDATLAAATPLAWAKRAVAVARRHGADRVVAEVNQGGEMVEAMLRQVDPALPVSTVRAQRGKWLRAEPVAALYEQGRVLHAGTFPALEDEMAEVGRDGLAAGRSPDRLDALVWAVTALMIDAAPEPRVTWL